MSFEQDQETARRYDSQEAAAAAEKGLTAPEPTRFLFPATDGGELSSRWDMQQSPPDILVTNVSMLGTMLSREVEASIFERTVSGSREMRTPISTSCWMSCTWCAARPEPRLQDWFARSSIASGWINRSTGTSFASWLPARLCRWKARTANAARGTCTILRTVRYFEKPGASGANDPRFWRECVVPGSPHLPELQGPAVLDPVPFRRLADLLTDGGKTIGRPTERSPVLDEAMSEAFVALC